MAASFGKGVADTYLGVRQQLGSFVEHHAAPMEQLQKHANLVQVQVARLAFGSRTTAASLS